MKYPKRSQYKYAKPRYRVRNWAEYEAGLQKRGDVIVWLEGFLRCLAEFFEIDLPIRDHTTLSRRLKTLRVIGFRTLATGRPIHLLIVASDLTARRTHDCTQVPALLEQITDPLASVSADGAYDSKAVYEAAHEQGEGRAVRVLIPLGRNAQLNPEPSAALRERNRNIRSIRELGRCEWHSSSGYSKRSMVENTIFRHKTGICPRLRAMVHTCRPRVA